METGYLGKLFERVKTEIAAFPNMGILAVFHQLDEFYPSFRYFTLNLNHHIYIFKVYILYLYFFLKVRTKKPVDITVASW